MATPQEHAANATTALYRVLRISPSEGDAQGIATIIEQAVVDATRERKRKERKHVAEVEAEARERLARLLSSLPAVIYSFRACEDFAPTFVSDSITRLFGYEASEYLENPDFWRERVHPDDVARVDAEVGHLFGNGGQTLEYRFRRKNGAYCWVSDEQHLVRGENGEPLEVVGSWSDITARKKAEEAQEAARVRLKQLLATLPAVIYSFEARGDFRPTFVSQNIEDLLGYEPREYLENSDFWRSRVHPDDIGPVEAGFGRLFETDRHVCEYRFLKKDGTYCWVGDESRLTRDAAGEPLEVVGSWSDITARKQAEEAVAATRARLDHLLACSPAVIYSFQATGDYAPTFISQNVKRLLGYEPVAYLEDPGFWLNRVHPDDLPHVTGEFSRLFEVGRHAHEYRFLRQDGTYCWVDDQLQLIRDDDGNPVEVVGSWADVSSRKVAEDARRETEQRLVDAIESIGEGFAFYDADDRLATYNTRYGEMLHAGGMDGIAPGVSFESIIRNAAASGRIPEAEAVGLEAWIAARLARHRDPGPPVMQRRSNGQWIQVSERRVSGGGIVAVYSDLTELKENEERAAKAHRLILESLHYASRIQSAILPARRALATAMHDHFLVWEPRDIVGGDFFWFHRATDGYFIIIGDCTGHGVPGAFMTLIVCGLLDRHLRSADNPSPARLLGLLHRDLQALLGQDQAETADTDDGFEAGVCYVDEARRKLAFAGARFSLWWARNGKLDEIKGDKAGIGYRRVAAGATFTDTTLDLVAGEAFYMTTDGLTDQIGGLRRRSLGRTRFTEVLAQHQGRPMAEQRDALMAAFAEHQGAESRRDDVTVLGFAPLGM